jgi:hypothetical protein
MKLCLLLLFFSFVNKPDSKFVLVDRNLKRPAVASNHFYPEQFMYRTFPLYSEDLPAVIEAAEAAARRIEQPLECGKTDSVVAGHTRILITAGCQPYHYKSVRIVTKIDDQRIWCDFELVREEDRNRKIQRLLLDFSTYLSK